MAKTYREAMHEATYLLESHGKEGYAIQSVFLTRKKWTKTMWLLSMHEQITQQDEKQLQDDLESLLKDIPPQYLTGVEEFYGRVFKVNEHTLIPRPETEELVQLCLNMVSLDQARVVDIGTGTGAIAISLKAERPTWQVFAIDLSEATLSVAKENATQLQTPVEFYQGDTLAPVRGQLFDVIISNPPYISETEWDVMDASVRQFEPKLALFAEDNGLAMYRKIADQAKEQLSVHGKIFLEIGYRQGYEVQELFKQVYPNKQVEIKKDMFGNDRMIVIH